MIFQIIKKRVNHNLYLFSENHNKVLMICILILAYLYIHFRYRIPKCLENGFFFHEFQKKKEFYHSYQEK